MSRARCPAAYPPERGGGGRSAARGGRYYAVPPNQTSAWPRRKGFDGDLSEDEEDLTKTEKSVRDPVVLISRRGNGGNGGTQMRDEFLRYLRSLRVRSAQSG